MLNGGLIYDFSKDEALAEELLGDADKELTRYVLENMPDVSMEVHTKDVCYVPRRTNETDIHEEYEKIIPQFASFDEIKDKRWLKVLFIPGSVERRNELMQTGLEIC